jgi:hypothetical protein
MLPSRRTAETVTTAPRFDVPEPLASVLTTLEWATVPYEREGDCALLLSVPRKQAWLLMAHPKVRPEVFPLIVPRGLRLRVRVVAKSFAHNPYAPLIDLDVSKVGERRLAERLIRQESLKVVALDKDLCLIELRVFRWTVTNRRDAARFLRRADREVKSRRSHLHVIAKDATGVARR